LPRLRNDKENVKQKALSPFLASIYVATVKTYFERSIFEYFQYFYRSFNKNRISI